MATSRLEIKIGLFSLSQRERQAESRKGTGGKSFAQVRRRRHQNLGGVAVQNPGHRRHRSGRKDCSIPACYRSLLWPVLRSDVNGEFTDESRQRCPKRISSTTPFLACGTTIGTSWSCSVCSRPKSRRMSSNPLIDRGEAHRLHAHVFPRRPCARRSSPERICAASRGYDIKSARIIC